MHGVFVLALHSHIERLQPALQKPARERIRGLTPDHHLPANLVDERLVPAYDAGKDVVVPIQKLGCRVDDDVDTVLDGTEVDRARKRRINNEGIALVVDSTFASPVNFRPIEHGVDVVIHSATKYLNGHHDILAGVVCGNEPFIDEVRRKMMVWGQAPDPFACWLLERGLKTLDVRVKRQNENAMQIAEWCSKRPEIAKVHYPGLPSHPDHEIAKSILDGFGGMMAIEIRGAGPAAIRFAQALKVFAYAASLGGVDSLVIEPRYSSHEHMSAEERARIGIPDGFLRMSIGIENVEDLIADIEQALQQ